MYLLHKMDIKVYSIVHKAILFLPCMVAIGIVCSQWSYGALIACSIALILHLKRIC